MCICVLVHVCTRALCRCSHATVHIWVSVPTFHLVCLLHASLEAPGLQMLATSTRVLCFGGLNWSPHALTAWRLPTEPLLSTYHRGVPFIHWFVLGDFHVSTLHQLPSAASRNRLGSKLKSFTFGTACWKWCFEVLRGALAVTDTITCFLL